MRCQNCGFDGNSSDSLRCAKCNFPLAAPAGGSPAPRDMPPPTPSPIPAAVAGTVNVNPSDQAPWDAAAKPLSTCIHCDYPLAGTNAACPKCGKNVAPPGAKPKVPGGKAKAKPAPLDINATIDPFRQQKSRTRFRLIPIDEGQPNEEGALEFNGADVALNRENLDPGNPSITGKTQASIQLIEEEWHIIDQSSLQTTFVRPGRPTPLEPGDIIVLGDRRYVFE